MDVGAFRTSSGKRLSATSKVGHGGQGDVFALRETSEFVLKVYKADVINDDPLLDQRLRLMVSQRPEKWRDAHSGHVVLTWPAELVLQNKKFVGFLMPRIDSSEAIQLHRLTNPTDARKDTQGLTTWARGFTWKYLVSTAANLSSAVATLHESRVVVADFNDANVLVWKDATVTMVDCDSMQITDSSTGTHFLCHVGRPEFTPPELLMANWNTTVRSSSSDLFALAVHIHQLILEGEHPFRGVWHGTGEVPPAEEFARRGLWAYAGDPQLSPRPVAMPLDLLPDQIVNLFRRAFVDGATNPRHRPSAPEWRNALTHLDTSLVVCSRNAQHLYRRQLTKCPWCTHESTRKRRRQAAPRAFSPANLRQTILVAANPLPATPGLPATTPAPNPAPTTAAGPLRQTVGFGSSRPHRHYARTLALVAVLGVSALFAVWIARGQHHPPSGASDSSAPFNSPAVGMAATADGGGYWLVDSTGQVDAYGDAQHLGQPASTNGPIVSITSTRSGKGYWLLDQQGNVYTEGDAGAYGSLPSDNISVQAVGLAPSSDGRGYWILGADGGIFAFGDAPYEGAPKTYDPKSFLMGIAPDWATDGYWVAAADGSVYSFNAPFLGSSQPLHDSSPVLGIQAESNGAGYRLVASNGGIFAYGASFLGSLSGTQLNQPIKGIAGSDSPDGYWLFANDGGVFAFGGAQFYGSAA
jgi:hypothetical protein